ncbi:MAG: protein-L-isoaspartate O-methyltransferase [Magnetococcales bacterium]|nr:protein-L-isoaspartate O-methyltransferase [Magnetococcales bacterium]
MDFSAARVNMVQSQLVPNRVYDESLLESVRTIPRESFVDPRYQEVAYSDYAVPLGDARCILKPVQSALMIQAMQVLPGQKVLVVGAGTGYEAMVLARVGARVFALESDTALAARGQELTRGMAVEWKIASMELAWAEAAPFDAILFCGAVPVVPSKAVGLLADQGRLVAILGKTGDRVMQVVRLVGRVRSDFPERLFETQAPVLPGFEDKKAFQL